MQASQMNTFSRTGLVFSRLTIMTMTFSFRHPLPHAKEVIHYVGKQHSKPALHESPGMRAMYLDKRMKRTP
jgi:hypothetical protein